MRGISFRFCSPRDCARVEERVFVASGNGAERSIYPDLHVVEHHRGVETSAPAETGVAVAEPLVIHIPDEPVTQGFIEIIDVSSGNRVITVIEVLSPSNKISGPGKDLYLQKQEELPYQICARRGWRPTTAEVYRAPLRERLPIIKVPLRESDAEVPLDLQSALDQCYRNGRYDEDIDYQTEPDPPLDPADVSWADELLRGQGRR
jgi:Protein of unknown function (DUF4058)